MICVGDKKAKSYHGDYGPAQFYKGDVKIAGYNDTEKAGTQISGMDTYNDALLLTIEGKSEQTATAQGKNLFDEERIMPTQGWVKQSDGSFFVPTSDVPYGKFLWENTDGYTGQLSVDIKGYKDGVGGGNAGPYILIAYTDGTVVGAGGAENLAWTTHQKLTDPIKSVANLSWSYGGGGFGSYVKDILIAKSNAPTPYEPFVPNSPSPDYPATIRSSESFDVVSCGKNLFPSLQKEKLIANALIGNLKLGSNITITGSCDFQNGKIVVPVNSRIVIAGSWNDDASDLRNRAQWVGLKPNTAYTLRAKLLPFSGQIYRLFDRGGFTYRDLRNGYIAQPITTDSKGTYTYSPENFIYILRTPEYTPDEIVISDMQLEEGTVATTYQPHHATTTHVIDPLRSVGDVSDSIEVSGGKVEVVRRCNQYTFTGAPKDKIVANCTYGCFNGVLNFKYSNLAEQFMLSSSLTFLNLSALLRNVADNSVSIGGDGAFITVWFRVNEIPQTKSEMETWLSKNPVTVQYILGSPTRTDITATPLGQELLALRTQPHETKVFTNATLPPTLRAKIKEML